MNKNRKISRTLTGEISAENLDFIDELHMEYPVVDTLFTGDTIPSDPLEVVGNDYEKLNLVKILYIAGENSNGLEAVKIFRTAIRIDLDASVDMTGLTEDGRIFVIEHRLKNIISLLQKIPEMVPEHMRRAVELGSMQNIAGVQFLLDKYNAGKGTVIAAMQPDSPSIAMYENVFYTSKETNLRGKGELVHKTVMLYSGINLIEVLIEAGLTDRIYSIYDDLVEFFGSSKQVNIGRLLYFNVWAHNRQIIKQLINPRVAA